MKFITEDELRDLYKASPFTDYDLQPGERLTPGARQFLVDRGIDMYSKDDIFTEHHPGSVSCRRGERRDRVREKKMMAKIRLLEATFLLTSRELIEEAPDLSRRVTDLYRYFSAVARGKSVTPLTCEKCTGMDEENFSSSLGPCFELTEFHAGMERGKEMLLLARLRSCLEEFDADLNESTEKDEYIALCSAGINRIINKISGMMCRLHGGKECLRKI